VQFRLRDWGISRQRYWGCPIPIIHCADLRRRAGARRPAAGGAARRRAITGAGSPLAKMPEFYDCACPKCGKPARRETDTMDTFVESSWYFLRYACPDNTRGDGGRARRNYWCNGRPVHRRHRARHPAPALLALLDQG
jgi:leucyl-tRNA synthetase